MKKAVVVLRLFFFAMIVMGSNKACWVFPNKRLLVTGDGFGGRPIELPT